MILPPQQAQVVAGQLHVHFSPERPEGKGGIGELACILDHSRPDRVAVDVTDTGEVVVIGVDDAGLVAVAPKMSCPAHGPIVPDSDPGVEILHSPVEVFLGGCGKYMVVVGHEDNVMDEKMIFFNGFGQGFENDAGGLSLVEAEGPVVGPADQMIGVGCLDNP